MTDTRQPGLITPDNAPRLADLNDDTAPYPAQITITCDGCPILATNDYLVPADSDKADRFEIARDHLRTLGWSCTEAGDWCPGCAMLPVLEEIQAERGRQIAKWGVQHHPDGTLADEFNLDMVQMWKDLVDRDAFEGKTNWTNILFEEVYEAAAEENVAKLRVELVQIAAVCVAWVEDIDSRTAGA